METINREELLELRRREELIKYNDFIARRYHHNLTNPNRA